MSSRPTSPANAQVSQQLRLGRQDDLALARGHGLLRTARAFYVDE
jgi:hypothetical protein